LHDAPSVFAKASECTLLLNLQQPYAYDDVITAVLSIRLASGFLKSILDLQSDFVCFKFLIRNRHYYLGVPESKNIKTAVSGYSSKAKGSNVRGVGTFFDTCF
jgi:hypothetical protein